jgi:hypothetical protein
MLAVEVLLEGKIQLNNFIDGSVFNNGLGLDLMRKHRKKRFYCNFRTNILRYHLESGNRAQVQ